jgi:multidrug efflux pump subunit AcrB
MNQIDADTKRMQEVATQMSDINRTIASNNTNLPSGLLRTLYNDRTYALNAEYQNLSMKREADMQNYTLWTNNQAQILGIQVEKYQAQRQDWLDTYSIFKDKFGIIQDNVLTPAIKASEAQFNADLNYEQNKKLMELEESYTNPMLNSSDPVEAQRALKQTLQTYYDNY